MTFDIDCLKSYQLGSAGLPGEESLHGRALSSADADRLSEEIYKVAAMIPHLIRWLRWTTMETEARFQAKSIGSTHPLGRRPTAPSQVQTLLLSLNERIDALEARQVRSD